MTTNIIKAYKRIIFFSIYHELFFFDTWKNDAIFPYKKFTNKNRIEIKTDRNTITNTNNLHATCMVMLSSSAPWRPGTSARQRRGRPWSLKFLFFYNGFSGPHRCISKKTRMHQIRVKKYFIMQIYPWDMLGFPIICLVFIVLNWTISKREQNPYIS